MQLLMPYVPVDRRQALYHGTVMPDRTVGAALFADISGFTPLTGALMKEFGSQRGAEKLLDIINPIYEALITRLHAYKGSVIGFAGDAITCWLDGDDGRRATACALDMQAIMQRFARVVTPGGAEVVLAVKISAAAGPARRFLVGNPGIHHFEALAGMTLERMAAAEQQSQKGEVVVSAEVAANLGLDLGVKEWRVEEETGQSFAVVAGLNTLVPIDPWPEIPSGALPDEQLRSWVDARVYERLISGAAYIAELRPATSLFLKFGGIDYDQDDGAGQKLDTFIRWVQSVLQRYEGAMLGLTIGDKGSNLIAVFGAPVAHDDDMARAVAAGLALRNPPAELAFVTGRPKIGISQGIVWAGACGGRVGCIYTVMGNDVNMAACLMAKAHYGQVLVNQPVADATRRRFCFQSLGLVQVKGRAEPLPVSEAMGRQEVTGRLSSPLFSSPLVGREEYLETLREALAKAQQGHGQVVRLEGPAGAGKSHLAAVFAGQAEAQGWQVITGLAQSTTQTSPYLPWSQAINALLGLEALPPEERGHSLEALFADSHPEWLERLPVLRDLLGIAMEDSPVTAALEPRRRQEALFSLTAAILQDRAETRPLLIVMEDVHWLDEASATLMESVARSIERSPIVLLIVQRPALEGQSILPGLDALDIHQRIELGDLSAEGAAVLLRNRMGASLSPLALELMFAQAQGNPFFNEELCDALREMGYLERSAAGIWDLSAEARQALLAAGCMEKIEGEWHMVADPPLAAAGLNLPGSVQGTVLARMDRMPESEKLVLKVASVIGRTFSLAILRDIHPAHPGGDLLQREIADICARDFVRIEGPGEEPLYIFKHNITQEAAYSTLLFAQRKDLHAQAVAWYERQAGSPPLEQLSEDSPLAVHYPLLAHHWRQAENAPRERVYDGLAGRQAARQFANESAINYFSRALELAPDGDLDSRYDLLIQRERVLDVMGRREQQEEDLNAMETLVAKMENVRFRAQVLLRQAIVQDLMAEFHHAEQTVQQALSFARQAQAADLEMKAMHEWGRILCRLEQNDNAQDLLTQAHALAVQQADELQQSRTLVDLGVIAHNQRRYPEALAYFEKALEINRRIGNRSGEIACHNMLANSYQGQGEYGLAQDHTGRGLALSRATGYRYEEAMGLYIAGNLHFYLGEYSRCRETHRQALKLWREIGAAEYEAISLDTLGLVEYIEGGLEQAERYVRQALRIHQETRDTFSQGFDHNHLGLVLLAAGDPQEALVQHEMAISIRREAEQKAMLLDDLAGLVRVSLALDETSQAASLADEILASLEACGPDGLEFPVWVYLTCYRALRDVMPEKARQALEMGFAILRKSANSIQEEALRKGFLENVPWNRELLREGEIEGIT